MVTMHTDARTLGATTLGGNAARTIDDIPAPPAWHNKAACTDMAPDFDDDRPVGIRDKADLARIARARKTCHACPVRIECLTDAFATERKPVDCAGIRGATAAHERAGMIQLARRGRAIRCTVHCLTELHPGQVHRAWLASVGLPTGGTS